MWLEPVWTPLLALLFWVARTKGEIRCYCNDASCISTGYMCKSSGGRCFSQFTYEAGDNARSAHGCVESLPLADRTVCEGDAEVIKARSDPQRWPILMCCRDDMCNYHNNPVDISLYINTKSNGSNGGNSKTTLRPRERPYPETEYRYLHKSYQQRDLWFKAAVIAVPISGGFILVLLVLLAIRMLRHDNRRHRQLMAMRRHRSLTKAQLYVADHFYDKTDRHAHFNSIDSKRNHMYKDVNIRVDCDSRGGYEKMTDSCQHGGSCSSIIVWGKSGLPADNPASVV